MNLGRGSLWIPPFRGQAHQKDEASRTRGKNRSSDDEREEKREKAWVTDQETPTWTAEFKKKKKRKGETNKKQKQKNFPEKKIKFQIKRV